nr:hypothetical protein GCM10020093_056210 [Planobispora longispora]
MERPAEKRVVDLVNQARADRGCAPVVFDARLYAAARGHSTDMAENGYFSHTSKDGRNPGARIREAGFSRSAPGPRTSPGASAARSPSTTRGCAAAATGRTS